MAGGNSSALPSGARPAAPWRDRARDGARPNSTPGLYAKNELAPRAPGTRGSAFAVGGGVAVGGLAYSGSYFQPACSSSSSFAFSLFAGGGGWGFGFSYGSGNWCAPPCYSWAPCGGWTPYCGWGSPGWCGPGWGSPGWCGSGWAGSSWCGPGWCAPCNPWWRPPVFWDPWCAPVAWPACYTPAFSLCFGLPAYTTVVYNVNTFQPAPPPVVVMQPPAVVLASPDQAWGLLANGFDQQAMQDFAALQMYQPGDPGHDVGYALAQAMLGVDDGAIVAMRRALSTRPEALLLVPTDPALRARLESLAARLKDKSKALSGTIAGRQTLFLLASVDTILYANGDAYFAINSAIEQGDNEPSSFALKGLLQGRLSV